MNLIPVITTTMARDGKSFVFTDATGVDNQATSSKYWNGVTTRANLNISLNTTHATKPDKIDDVTLIITKPSEEIYTFDSFDVPVTTVDYTVTNTAIGESDVIPDGVYTFEYILYNLLTVSASGTEGTQTVTFSALPTSLEVGQYIKFAIDGTLYTITAIDSDADSITLDQNLTDTYSSHTSMYVGYRYFAYKVFDYNISCCIDKAIATAAVNGCCDNCISEPLRSAANMKILLMGAQAQAANGLQVEAQDTIDTITTICNSGDVDCNCN